MSSSTRWTSRALAGASAGGLLVLGAAFSAGGVGAASADDTPPTLPPATAPTEPPTTAAPERPGPLPPELPTPTSPQPPTTAPPERPGPLPPLAAAAEPAPGVPTYTG